MRFEVQYPDRPPHEVELQGSLVVVGRDPSSDLVLHDVKCSRRHAVLEAGPDGITVRDTGSANGIYVNGQKVERAPLKAGDVMRLGDTVLKLLPEDVPGTVVMGQGDLPGEVTIGDATVVPPLRAPRGVMPSPPVPPPVTPAGLDALAGIRRAARRPLTVNVLAGLWLMSVPMYGLGGLALALRAGGLAGVLWAMLGLLLAALSAVMALGLWTLRPWARIAQIAVAAAGLVVCPFTLASGVVLVYMLTHGREAFAEKTRSAEPGAVPPEAAFAAALLGLVMLGALGSALLMAFFFRFGPRVTAATPGHPGPWPGRLLEGARAAAREDAAAVRLQRMAAAQEAFRQVCNNGYAELEALLRPRSVLPTYPPDGPAFLDDATFRQPEHAGYRFELQVEGPLPVVPGCPSRSFSRYRYAAWPRHRFGRCLAVANDGVVRVAAGRLPTAEDPPLR